MTIVCGNIRIFRSLRFYRRLLKLWQIISFLFCFLTIFSWNWFLRPWLYFNSNKVFQRAKNTLETGHCLLRVIMKIISIKSLLVLVSKKFVNSENYSLIFHKNLSRIKTRIFLCQIRFSWILHAILYPCIIKIVYLKDVQQL